MTGICTSIRIMSYCPVSEAVKRATPSDPFFGTFDRGPCHFKKLLGDFTVEFIVFNQQYMLPRKS